MIIAKIVDIAPKMEMFPTREILSPMSTHPTATPHVLFFYRNYNHKDPCVSHIGLGCSCLLTCKVLRRYGINCDVCPIWDATDIAREIKNRPETTHAVIEAPFIGAADIKKWLLVPFPRVKFTCRCHSQIGFLQVEAGAITLVRDYGNLEEGCLNFQFSANANRFVDWYTNVYDNPCIYLPNLYDTKRPSARNSDTKAAQHTLRVASFGALRLLKNHTTAAAAAQLLAKARNTSLEFWVSVGREENGKGVIQALRNMFTGLQWAKLVENPWQDWGDFRKVVAHMDLCMQVSMSETFNIVTADALAEGVPSVVSDAIDWLPKHWTAKIDDPADIARVGSGLLSDRNAIRDGYKALDQHVKASVPIWLAWLHN